MTSGSSSSFPIMRLAAAYNKQMKNGNLLSNRAAIDMIDKRILQLAERIELNDMPDRVKVLYSLWMEYKDDLHNGRATEATMGLISIDEAFEKIYHDYAAWGQVFEALDVRRKMVDSEVKVLKEIKAIITAEDAYQLMAKALAVMMRVLEGDPKKLKQVQYEFAKLIGESSDLVIESDDGDDWGGGEPGGSEEGLGNVDQTQLLYPGDEG